MGNSDIYIKKKKIQRAGQAWRGRNEFGDSFMGVWQQRDLLSKPGAFPLP